MATTLTTKPDFSFPTFMDHEKLGDSGFKLRVLQDTHHLISPSHTPLLNLRRLHDRLVVVLVLGRDNWRLIFANMRSRCHHFYLKGNKQLAATCDVHSGPSSALTKSVYVVCSTLTPSGPQGNMRGIKLPAYIIFQDTMQNKAGNHYKARC